METQINTLFEKLKTFRPDLSALAPVNLSRFGDGTLPPAPAPAPPANPAPQTAPTPAPAPNPFEYRKIDDMRPEEIEALPQFKAMKAALLKDFAPAAPAQEPKQPELPKAFVEQLEKIEGQLKKVESEKAALASQTQFDAATAGLRFRSEAAKNVAFEQFSRRFELMENGAYKDTRNGSGVYINGQPATRQQIAEQFLRDEFAFLLDVAPGGSHPKTGQALQPGQAGANGADYRPSEAELNPDTPEGQRFLLALGRSGQGARLRREGLVNRKLMEPHL